MRAIFRFRNEFTAALAIADLVDHTDLNVGIAKRFKKVEITGDLAELESTRGFLVTRWDAVDADHFLL